jgi:hypothetical protein
MFKLDIEGKVASATLDGKSITLESKSNGASGTSKIIFSATRAVQAQVFGPGGSASCSTTVQVNPIDPPSDISCSLSANATSVLSGDVVTLSLTTRGTLQSATFENETLPLNVPFARSFTLQAPRTFTASVTDGKKTASCNVAVAVSQKPMICDPTKFGWPSVAALAKESATTFPFDRTGAGKTPVAISSLSDFNKIRSGGHYVLTNDIDLGGQSIAKLPLMGAILDGAGYTIKNAKVSGGDYLGLFSLGSTLLINLKISNFVVNGREYVGALSFSSSGSTIANVSLENVSVNASQYAGGFFGGMTELSLIADSCFQGQVTGTGNYIGGMSGSVSGNLQNVSVRGHVTGGSYIGGIAGSVSGNLQNVSVYGQVSGYEYVGGLLGSFNKGVANGGYVDAHVTLGKNYGGGAFGSISPSHESTVEVLRVVTSPSTTVQGKEYIGGLIGSSYPGFTGVVHIADSWSQSKVDATDYVGGFAGAAVSSTDTRRLVITRSKATGSLTGTNEYIGGFAGSFSGYLLNVSSTVAVNAQHFAGGLVGALGEDTAFMSNDKRRVSVIRDSYAEGSLTGKSVNSSSFGGLAGCVRGTNIERSNATGSVVAGTKVGGLVGTLTHNGGNCDPPGYGFLKRLFSSEAYAYAPPASENFSQFLAVRSSYAHGAVTGWDKSGGLIGYMTHGVVETSYAAGPVHVTPTNGGLIGTGAASENVKFSYWDRDRSGQTRSVGGTPLSSQAMKNAASFGGFDFTTIWKDPAGAGYPKLR